MKTTDRGAKIWNTKWVGMWRGIGNLIYWQHHHDLEVGDRVEAGYTTDELDEGRVIDVRGYLVRVAWDSGVETIEIGARLRRI